MEGPYYRGYWDLPSRSRPGPRPRQSPSVREIPVRFVESEPLDRSGSAVKIQKVFRGFLVRKSVKKIVQLRSEVEEIEKRISNEETIDLIRRDSKERLKVNEILMSLLFKLDSVRGVDSGIRDCRKTVIRKAIALQEVLDAVASNNGGHISNNDAEKVVEVVNQSPMECANDGETRGSSPAEAVVSSKIDHASDNVVDDVERVVEVVDQTVVERKQDGENLNTKAVDDMEKITKNQNDNGAWEAVGSHDVMPDATEYPGESVETGQTESQSDSSSNPQCLIEACEGDHNPLSKQENNDNETHQAGQREVDTTEACGSGTEKDKRNRELLERMMEDNEKMMDMMAQLFERNEIQTRLLSSLSQRVEQLERAFMCERLRKKKKRQAAGTVDGCGTTPDGKKCGKRQ